MKNTNLILFALLFFSAENLNAEPHIKCDKYEIDFGKMEQRIRETRFFEFKNTGDDTLKIIRVRSNCGCAAAIVSSENIPPGEKGKIEITFNSSTYVGQVSKIVKIHTNDPANNIVDVKVKADVLPPTVRLRLFYLKDCGNSEYISEKIFGPLKKKYKLEIESFDISSSRNYELLVKHEEHCNSRGNKLPVLIIGRSVLGGKDEIEKNLENRITGCFRVNCDLPVIETERNASKKTTREIQLVYFYDREYKKCDRTGYELEYLENKYPALSIVGFDIGDIKNKKLYEDMCDFFEVPEELKFIVPVVFIGDKFFVKEDITGKEPEKIIEEFILSNP